MVLHEVSVKFIASSVLNRWLIDAKTPHLWAVPDDVETAAWWCETLGVPTERFMGALKKAHAEGRAKKDGLDWSLSAYLNAHKKMTIWKQADYEKWCRRKGLVASKSEKRIQELCELAGLEKERKEHKPHKPRTMKKKPEVIQLELALF